MNWAPCDFVFSLAYSKGEQLLYLAHLLVAQTVARMTTGTHEGMAREQDQTGREGWQCWLWKYGMSECELQHLQFAHGMESKQT